MRRSLVPKPLNIFIFIGPPGVGKGTFAKILSSGQLITSRLTPPVLEHLSIGDVIRQEIKSGSQFGIECTSHVEKGLLVSDFLVNAIVTERLAKLNTDVILDGYPRNVAQASFLETILPSNSHFPSPILESVSPVATADRRINVKAINISLDRNVATEKLLHRATCRSCQRSFNTAHVVRDDFDMPAILPHAATCPLRVKSESSSLVCDDGVWHCPGMQADALEKRSDDKADVIARRFEEFDRQVEPLLEFYRVRNQLATFEVMKGVRDAEALLEAMLQI